MSDSDRKRWALVTTTGVLTGVGHGFAAFAVSALLKPLALDLDTGRGAVSIAIGLGRLVSGLSSPVVGRITDLHGPRLIVMGGMILSAVGLFALSFVQSELQLYFAWSLLLAAGTAAGFTVALDKLVVATFVRRRGMALAVRFSISAVVATLIVPIVSFMVEHVGWRQTCIVWGVIILFLIPVPAIWFRQPPAAERRTLEPKGLSAPEVQSFWRNKNFWLIAVALCTQASVTTGLTVHLLPMMTDYGLDPVFAGTLFGVMILLTIPFRLLAGYIGDRLDPRHLPSILGGLIALEGLAICSFPLTPGLPSVLVVVCALGIAAGAPMVLVLVICNELFGQSSFGTVQGSLMMVQVPGTMLAPALAGYAYDFTGSYVAVIAGFGVLLIAGGSMLGFVRMPAQIR
ncbi:MFS transporter [Nitratireductor aestuarii]|uniref:MFS transporter n=1 Tax=Nitratireductor aestuarii TaxID=1735103 RepID=A0A916W5N7_9HYPH|nr:MFS transporter [Nitratireductor aestuarii]GGA68901.1 MFS transporter [Nitratireductor aestuarii]